MAFKIVRNLYKYVDKKTGYPVEYSSPCGLRGSLDQKEGCAGK